MGAIVTTVLNAVLTTVARDATGALTRRARVSKTKLGAGVAAGTGVWALLPQALEGDERAIGALVVMGVSWIVTLWGRWRAEQEAA